MRVQGEKGNNLAELLDRHQLTATVSGLAQDSRPHRALWDATGTALLLGALIAALYPGGLTIDELLTTAGRQTSPVERSGVQEELFG